MTLGAIEARREDVAVIGGSLKDRVAELFPLIRQRALATERARRVPAANIAALREMGYFDVVKPAAYGGSPRPFAELVDANIELSAACASTGWVAGLLSAHQWLLAMFPKEAQDDVWDENPGALLCGSYAPTSMAERVEGGYRLNGRWSFASGCDNAQWSLCAAILPTRGEEKPVPAFLLVPAHEYMIDDTWEVVGLAGTGSKTLVLDNVVVPEHRVLTFPQATSGRTPGAKVYPRQGLFNMPLLTGIPSCLASAAVGAAKGALESYVASISTRVTRGAVAGGNNRMAEFPTIQLRVAEAAASVDAAREILLRDVAHAEALAGSGAGSGNAFSVEDRLVSRRGQAFAVSLALRAVEALNASTGGTGLNLENPVQRAWRDANAVGRHISMNWDAVGTMIGQHMLGLEPKGQY
ncbi:flavin-dependent monooxygenase [Allomesorhizobium camelthorni]|uniref:Flavin-dependent monooxygenase n=1 Tax=Allomesorhizobium camelthorni TaxID=475069 RepID=A0A6G4WDF8_9HYPH|nr:flavin-dependent monooxygenase [Mesorhizobium camelthorni]NGO52791.1 flavin-dependent monooxygenase [Mesorhizobium camelthorni]